IDTGRVRHWPRMKRHELALLFPSGRSKHRPSGGALRKRDVTAARKKYASLAKRIAAFQRDRAAARSRLRGQEPTLFAAARGVPGASAATRVAAAPVPSRLDGGRAAGSWATASTVTATGGNGPAPSSGEGSPSGAGAASLLASAADLLNARTWQVPAPALATNGAVAALAADRSASRPPGAAPTGTASNDGTAPATGAAGTWVVARAQAPSGNRPAPAAGPSPDGTGARASIAEVADLLNGPGLSAQRGGVRAPLPRQVTAAAQGLAGDTPLTSPAPTAVGALNGAKKLARRTPSGDPAFDGGLTAAETMASRAGKDTARISDDTPQSIAAGLLRSASDVFLEMTGWANAPTFDVDHPDELNYRPFPIEAVLTADPLNGDEALSTLISPDFEGTRDWIIKPDGAQPLRLRPDSQLAALVWSSTFTRTPPDAALTKALGRSGTASTQERRVQTEQRRARL
ncbi:MAG: hypothetical protein AAGF32_09910, partial [Pseudomonadota bacterium]